MSPTVFFTNPRDSLVSVLILELTHPNNKNPFDQRETKATYSTVSTGNGVGQTERQAKSNPVKEESHWREREIILHYCKHI